MCSYSYREHLNKTTFRKIPLPVPWQCTNRNLASICSHFPWPEPRACACKHPKKHSIILTVYSLLKLDSESVNVAISFSWPVLAYRLTKSIPLKFKWRLKVCSALRKSSARPLNVCSSQVWSPNHDLPNEIVKNYTTFGFGPILKDPIAKVFYINLIYEHVHKRITIKNTASSFMNKKFILYLH